MQFGGPVMPSKNDKKIRIAMLGHKRIPSREGGVEIVVGELATRMSKKGYDVTCFNRKGHHVSGASFDEAEKTEYCGVKLKSLGSNDGILLRSHTRCVWKV